MLQDYLDLQKYFSRLKCRKKKTAVKKEKSSYLYIVLPKNIEEADWTGKVNEIKRQNQIMGEKMIKNLDKRIIDLNENYTVTSDEPGTYTHARQNILQRQGTI